ncbi:MAG: enoyl-CoA hydratase [Proteobacteria bacterium]|nr:MAG: enoyl-CoA hydratase [Pseudomonadota bacterium]
MTDYGSITIQIEGGVAAVTFSHAQGNCLPAALLQRLAESIVDLAANPNAKVLLLQSSGPKTFCAGASFDELKALQDLSKAQEFFMGFAKVILAIRDCPKFVVAKVQGKAVGGGVGLIAACDYVLASEAASLRLSEYALGFGPFVISAAVQRKIGTAQFAAMTIDTAWREAAWAKSCGLYHQVFANLEELESAAQSLCLDLASRNPEATKRLKATLWEGCENWSELLAKRAKHSSELALGEFVQREISRARS